MAIQNGAIQTECSRHEQRSVIELLQTDMCKPCKIFRRMCDMFREACFSPKMFPNQLNMGLPLRARNKKTFFGVETH